MIFILFFHRGKTIKQQLAVLSFPVFAEELEKKSELAETMCIPAVLSIHTSCHIFCYVPKKSNLQNSKLMF